MQPKPKKPSGPPVCPAFPRCGGCTLLDRPYPTQIRHKARAVRRALQEFTTPATTVRSIESCPATTGLRAKAVYPVALHGGRVRMGFFEEGTHQIVESSRCPAQAAPLTEAARRIHTVLEEIRPSIYDEARHRGGLRHVLLRLSVTRRELLVMLITTSRRDPRLAALNAELIEALQVIRPRGERSVRLAGLVRNINDDRGNTILGSAEHTLWGRPWIEETLDGLTLRISAGSFYQVNPTMAARLYRRVATRARAAGARRIVDAYSGVGAIALLLARSMAANPGGPLRGLEIHGIETTPAAVSDARENAKQNACSVTFERRPVERALPLRLERGLDLLVVDPPRAGLSDEVRVAIARRPPRHLIYVSCSLASLARDTSDLIEAGYLLREVQPFDLFPHTKHVEVMATFEKRGA